MVIGDPLSEKTDLGALVSKEHFDKVLIFNHGLGDDPSSWIFFAKEILKDIDNIKIILNT